MCAIKPTNEWITESPQETTAVAAELVTGGMAPRIFGLAGPLGSGKTTFVRGVVEACGGVEEPVRSPTFTLLNEYRTDPPVYHADLYRTTSQLEQETIGLDDYFDRGILLIEWVDLWQDRGPLTMDLVEFEYVDLDTRKICYYESLTADDRTQWRKQTDASHA